jgi:hypothetical protein
LIIEVPRTILLKLSKINAFKLETDAFGCHCHSLELAIKHGLSGFSQELEALRKFAKQMRKNSPTQRYLSQFNDNVLFTIPNDVATRWSSTYRMMDRFLSKKKVLLEAYDAYLKATNLNEKLPGMEVLDELLDT